jgi:hypothetical protein
MGKTQLGRCPVEGKICLVFLVLFLSLLDTKIEEESLGLWNKEGNPPGRTLRRLLQS